MTPLRFVGAGIRRQARATNDHLLGPITLDCAANETIVLHGPSGSGKSLFIELASGLRAPDTGVVRLGDVELHRIPPRRRDIGLLTQDAALYDHLDAARNIGFGAKADDDSVRAAARIACCTDLVEGSGVPVGTLSGGERRRVALAKALATGPSILLLDEPFEGLDPATHLAIRVALRAELDRREGLTIIAAHDRSDAIALADRVVLLDDGRIIDVATPRDLLDAPSSFEVATRFTHPGASVLAGEIEGSQVTVAGGTTTTDAPLPSTKAVSLVLPREAITLGGDGLSGWRVACHEPTESGLDLLCRHEDDPIPGNLLRVPCPAHEPTPAVGAGVTLTLIPSRMLVFPGRSNG